MIIDLKPTQNLVSAASAILGWLAEQHFAPNKHMALRILVHEASATDFLLAAQGLERCYFKSRDSDFFIAGLGRSDRIDQLALLANKTTELNPEQYYFSALAFDEESKSPEWQSFGRCWLILPLLQLTRQAGRFFLMLNYRADACLSWPIWLDHAFSICQAVHDGAHNSNKIPRIMAQHEQPSRLDYFSMIDRAKSSLSHEQGRQKVVLGRRNCLILADKIDPASLIHRLESQDAFVFLVDSGRAVFFGASPELLYRRSGNNFVTEALAGTRSRSTDSVLDLELCNDLLTSSKDLHEQALVAEYIEQVLVKLGSQKIMRSDIGIMPLIFVQHLVQHYHCQIAEDWHDGEIIKLLHPTPAVCGLSRSWSQQFISQHEGFDRGFYAGVVGCLGAQRTELTVAIRSALYCDQKIYVYAAGGIVPGSVAQTEWDELSNKQKNIMSIFQL